MVKPRIVIFKGFIGGDRLSKLLFDSPPLVVQPELAVVIGLNEAIVVQQVHYWLTLNQKTGKNFRYGYYWTYNSYEDWQKQFPFWSVTTIKRIITGLESAGILIVGRYNRMKMDRTKWYRINYKKLEDEVRENATSSLCIVSGIGEVKLDSSMGSNWPHGKDTDEQRICVDSPPMPEALESICQMVIDSYKEAGATGDITPARLLELLKR